MCIHSGSSCLGPSVFPVPGYLFRSSGRKLFLLLCADTASGSGLLCPLQLITSPSLCYPCPIVQAHHRAGGVHRVSPHLSADELWWSGRHQRAGLLLMCCLNKHQQWPLTIRSFRLCPGIRSCLHPTVESPPWPWLPGPVLHCDVA